MKTKSVYDDDTRYLTVARKNGLSINAVPLLSLQCSMVQQAKGTVGSNGKELGGDLVNKVAKVVDEVRPKSLNIEAN